MRFNWDVEIEGYDELSATVKHAIQDEHLSVPYYPAPRRSHVVQRGFRASLPGDNELGTAQSLHLYSDVGVTPVKRLVRHSLCDWWNHYDL